MQRKLIIILLIWILVLHGCAPSLSTKKVDPGKTVSLLENEEVVFGKIMFVEKGELNPWGVPVVPSLLHLESEKYSSNLLLENDGSFFWIVPRGTYIISGISGYKFTILPQIASRHL